MEQPSIYRGINNTVNPEPANNSSVVQIGKYNVQKKYIFSASVILICIVLFVIIFFSSSSDEKETTTVTPEVVQEEELSVITLGQIEIPLTFNKCAGKSFISQFNGHQDSNNGHLTSLGAVCTDNTTIPKIGDLNKSPLETAQSPEIGFNAIRVYYGAEEGMIVGFELFDKNDLENPIESIGVTNNYSDTGQFKCSDNMAFSGLRIAVNRTNNKLAALNLLCKKI